jgi:hypothetical protein
MTLVAAAIILFFFAISPSSVAAQKVGASHFAAATKQPTEAEIRGWIGQPNTRGTLDVLWNSLFTVLLCTWTVLCLNIPAEDDSQWQILWRKFRWMILALTGPESFSSASQSVNLRQLERSVEQFNMSRYPNWTLHPAFFADMGGFVPPPSRQPAVSNQCEAATLPRHKESTCRCQTSRAKGIKDRTKADGFTKFVTIMQTSWVPSAKLSTVPDSISP